MLLVGPLYRTKKEAMRYISTLLVLLGFLTLHAQELEDSVTMGPNYTNDIYYSLQDGIVSEVGGANWTVGFYNSAMSAAIMINEGRGVQLWKVTDDITQFDNITDTVGLSSWTVLHDADTTWDSHSAFEDASTGTQSNYGWGEYNFVSHITSGSRIFMLKSINNTYYKVFVEKKETGTFHYRYATLDNSFDTTIVVNVADYLNQNYAYLNMENHSLLERDPSAESWDFLFTRYITNFQGIQFYPVTGVLSNVGTQIAQVNEDPSLADYTGVAFKGSKNIIGDDWKAFDNTTFTFTVFDTITYFVKTEANDIYKLYFTGFAGGSTGKIKFIKEYLTTVSIKDQDLVDVHSIYPNPSKGSVTLVYSVESNESLSLNIYDLMGAKVYQNTLNPSLGLNAQNLSLENIENGVYLVQLSQGNKLSTQKLVINKN